MLPQIISAILVPGRMMMLLVVLSTFAVADDAATVSLKTGTWKDVQNYVEQHPGKVVIVDIWSTSCLPCMQEFPGLVELQEAHPDHVVAVSFNIDYAGIKSRPPEYYRERVEKFLTERKAAFRNYLCTTEAGDVLDDLKLNSIPAVYVFGKDGKLAKRFDDSLLEPGEEEAFTYKKDINPFVESLIKP